MNDLWWIALLSERVSQVRTVTPISSRAKLTFPALHSTSNGIMASEPDLPVAGIIQSEWESITPLAPPSSHASDFQQVSVIHYGFSNIPFDKIPLIYIGGSSSAN